MHAKSINPEILLNKAKDELQTTPTSKDLSLFLHTLYTPIWGRVLCLNIVYESGDLSHIFIDERVLGFFPIKKALVSLAFP